jgi:predicted PurR-regulated permease PerM
MLASLTPGRLTLLALLAALLYAVGLVLAPFWSEIFLAVILVVVFYPVHRWLAQRTRRPALALWLTTLGVGVLFLLPLSFFGLILVREARHAFDLFSAWAGPNSGLEIWNRALERIGAIIGVEAAQLQEMFLGRLQGAAGCAIENLLRSLQGFGSWIASTFISLITFFFLLESGPQILRTLKDWSPLAEDAMDELFAETEKLIFANIYGVLSVAVAQGSLTAIGFWFLGLSSPIFWGTAAAMLSVLPFIGAGFVWIPGALYLASIASYGKAAILFAWGVLVVGLADNVIRPIVLGEKAQMHTGLMFFALLGGIQAFGLIGLFAGPIVFSLAIAVLRLWRRENDKIAVR